MSDRPDFDGALGEVLRDVARDPSAVLLRLEAGSALAGWRDGSLYAAAGAAGLSTAERELLAVHREELALVLAQACRIAVYTSPPRTAVRLASRAPDDREVPLDPAGWRERARQLLATTDASGHEEATLLLERLVGGPDGPPPASLLALASLRLVPSPPVSVYLGMALDDEGSDDRALEVHRRVESRAAPAVRSFALRNRGAVHFRRGELGEALDAYRAAADDAPGAAEPLLNRFNAAVQLGLADEALEAAARLEDLGPNADAVAGEFRREALVAGRRRGVWRPTPEGRELLAAIEDRLPLRARKISDACR